MNDKCIINFAKNAWYPRGQSRLARSLMDTHFDGRFLPYNDEQQLGIASHEAQPYQFKIGAFIKVADAGFRYVLWCDAAVFAIKNIQPIFDHIERHGHIFFQSGFHCAQWTSDVCLEQMKVTRDEAALMPMYMACCMGLDLQHPRSRLFLDKLIERAKDGVSLPGAWRNANQAVSTDSRCEGHRHDQSIGSILAAQLGMEIIVGHHTYFAYYLNGLYRYGEINNMNGIADSVVMLSQGM